MNSDSNPPNQHNVRPTVQQVASESATESTGELSVESTIAMLGDGFYSRVSLGPKAVIDNACHLVLDALARVDHLSSTRPLMIADYGAADGGTSLDLMQKVIDKARLLAPDRPISVVYTDLPGADFGTLFRTVNGEVHKIAGYINQHKDVYVYACGLSFYRQLLPPASLDLAFSASAMHYLSTTPGSIKDHVHAVGATPAEQARYRAVALADWEQILLHRSRELAVGGRLVMANFCVDESGYYLGNTGGENMFDNYNMLWRGMRDDDIITAAEYVTTCFQQYYKSIQESLDPFQQEASPVFQSGLVLEKAETHIVPCPFRTAFERGELDVETFAQQFVNTHRSWTETTFRAGLDERRPAATRQTILDELYRRYEQLVLTNPQGHGKDLLHLYIVAAKIKPEMRSL